MRWILLVVVITTCEMALAEDQKPSAEVQKPVAEEQRNPDPWQGLNRVTHRFNSVVDRIVLRPLALGYRAILPRFVRSGVRHFFDNLDDVDNSVNNFLQGKPAAGASDLARVVINTTIGVGGLWDPASKMNLVKHEEDFGQTFSVWGFPRGPYLVLPFLGPSTVTDAVGRPFNELLDPVLYLHPTNHRNRLYLTRVVHGRASLLSAEAAVFGDEYLFYRDAYLQRREYLIKDGKVSDPFADEF